MRSLAIKSFLAVLAATLTLGVVAFAAATTGSDEPSPQPSSSVSASLAPAADDVADTAAPTVSSSAPITGVPGEDHSEQDDASASPDERTTAVNPAGHCVDLPASSNVIAHPDKHPNWTIEPCEPDGDATSPDGEEPEDDRGASDGEQPEGGSGPPEGRTPALNPDGACIEMPNNSDIVRHPEKHPDWTVAGCSTSGND